MNLKLKIQNQNKLRDKIKNNKVTVGSWIQIANSNSVELIANNGFDWLVIDIEHSNFNIEKLTDILRAIETNNSVPLIRAFSSDDQNLKFYLEIGFSGFIIPSIENISQLQKVHEQITFLPKGKRGVGFNRSNRFGEDFDFYHKKTNKPILIAQIETKKGLDNIDEILSYKNLDGIFIGPYDLSSTLNIPGDFKYKIYNNAIKKILHKCKIKNVACGIHLIDPEIKEFNKFLKQGFTIIGYSLDTFILRKYLKNPI